MTQFDPTFSDDEDDDSEEELAPKDLRRQLRAANKRAAELESQSKEMQGLQKENAFLKVNLPDTPVTRLFRDTYTGDLTEDAIRAGATDLGILESEEAVAREQVAAIGQQSAALNGSLPSMAPDSEEAMWKEFQEALQRGDPTEPVLRKYGRPVASDER